MKRLKMVVEGCVADRAKVRATLENALEVVGKPVSVMEHKFGFPVNEERYMMVSFFEDGHVAVCVYPDKGCAEINYFYFEEFSEEDVEVNDKGEEFAMVWFNADFALIEKEFMEE